MLCEIALCVGIVSSFSSKPKDKRKIPKPVGRSGTVTLYDSKKHNGLISGGRGDDYGFALVDWREDYLPRRGDKVTFVAVGNQAKDIHSAGHPEKNRATASQSDTKRYYEQRREPRPDAPKPAVPAPKPVSVAPVKPYSKEGTITEYNGFRNRGWLSGGEGDEYRFRLRDWRGEDEPTRGTAVKFIVVGNNARDVFPSSESKPQDADEDPEERKQAPSSKSGLVIDYNGFRKRGYLSGGEGDEYRFRLRDWRGEEPPTRGTAVKFIAVGKDARDVFPVAQSKPQDADAELEEMQHKPSDKSGLVIDYSRFLKRGVISGGRGDDYHFKRRDWRGDADPIRGDEVEFVAIGVHAKDIHPVVPPDPDEVHSRFDSMEQESEQNELDDEEATRAAQRASDAEETVETPTSTPDSERQVSGRFDPEARYIKDLGDRMSAATNKAGGVIGRYAKRWNRRK